MSRDSFSFFLFLASLGAGFVNVKTLVLSQTVLFNFFMSIDKYEFLKMQFKKFTAMWSRIGYNVDPDPGSASVSIRIRIQEEKSSLK